MGARLTRVVTRMHITEENVGFEGTEVVQTCDFDYEHLDEIAETIADAPDETRLGISEAIEQLLILCWKPGSTLKQATLRFTVLVSGIRPDLTERTYQNIADELGMTKANVSKAALRIQDRLKLQFKRSRSLTGRHNMAAAAKRHPPSRRRTTATARRNEDSF